MDNLATLFKKKQFDLIVNLTSGSNDVDAVTYRLNALIALGRYAEALKLVYEHNDVLYKKDPLKCMEIHFELLLHERKYLEAMDELKRYEDMPYVSQQVEEFLRVIPKKIANYQTMSETKTPFVSQEEANEIFTKSQDEAKIIATIYRLKPLDISPYLMSLLILLKRGDVNDDAKTMALLLLISKKVNRDVTINKMKSVYSINPANAVPPYTGESYRQTILYIYDLIKKEPAVQEVAINLLNQYIFSIYPIDLYHSIKAKDIALAFIVMGKQYLKVDQDVDAFLEENAEDAGHVMALVELYRLTLDK
ncbi:MAG: hypothetical protein MJ207_02375 [Bacilli bacterium]|nr:hypothetical protein [Bacilli bacterium]